MKLTPVQAAAVKPLVAQLLKLGMLPTEPGPRNRTSGDITLAVAAAGSDSSASRPRFIDAGDYSAFPFATLAAALEALPDVLAHAVVINLNAGTFAGVEVRGFSGRGSLTINGSGGGDTFLSAPASGVCLSVAGNTCPMAVGSLGFSGTGLQGCVDSNNNTDVTFTSLVVNKDTVNPALRSTGDVRVAVQSGVFSSLGDLEITGAQRVTIAGATLMSAGSLVVEDCHFVDARGIVATGATSHVFHAERIHTLWLECSASGGAATPVYLEAISNFLAVGTNKLTGSSNTGASTYGVEMALSGRYELTGSNITGAAGDVLFFGRAVTWTNLSSSTYGIVEEHAGSAIANSGYTKSLKYGNVLFMDNVDVSGRLLLYGYLNQSTNLSPLTATGSSASDAFDVGAAGFLGFVEVGTTPSGTGVKLPGNAAIAGVGVTVYNGGANALTVYPPSGGSINGGASYSLAAGKIRTFWSLNGSGGRAFFAEDP